MSRPGPPVKVPSWKPAKALNCVTQPVASFGILDCARSAWGDGFDQQIRLDGVSFCPN